MANIKFSQFTPQTDYNNVADLVGYDGLVNVRITPDDLISSYLSTHPQSAFVDGITIGDSGSAASVNVTIGSPAKNVSQINLNHAGGATDGGFIRGTSKLNLGVSNTDKLEIEGSLVTVNEDLLVDSSTATFTSLVVGRNASTPSIKNGGGTNGTLFFGSNASFAENWAGIGINSNESVSFFGSLFNGTQASEVGRVLMDPQGGGGGTGFPAAETMGTWRFSKYGAGNKIDNNTPYALGVDASGHLRENLRQPGCQIKIVGGAGLANTNNGADFLVPYNTVIVNDDATIFNPVVTGGFGNQGAIQVLQSGRYEFFARYSSFDLAQTSLPTLDGNKFFRITAATDVAAPGIGTKQCILQDLVVATSVNGEANVTGGGFMDLNAGDYFKIIGFHNGATGGSGTQGFPVSSNAFFNEPMLWLVKIQ